MWPAVKNFLSPAYLLNRNLGPFTSGLAWLFLAGAVLVMALAWLIRYQLAKNRDIFAKKAAKRFFNLAWVMGWISVVLWTFREINVTYLSAPILLLAAGLIALIWLVFVLYYWLKVGPRRRAQLSQEKNRRRYLP